MRASFISTSALVNTPRANLLRMQTELARLSTEISTGRQADIGLFLGSETSRSVVLRRDSSTLSSFLDGNALVSARLDQTQSVLDTLSSGANDFLKAILAAGEDDQANELIGIQADSALSAFIDGVNASDGKRHLFAGINSAVAPIGDFATGPQAAIDAAFQTRFGFPASDPQVETISATDMADFLDNDFAAIFDDTGWPTNWSSASDTVINSRVSRTDTLDSSVSANEQAFRSLAMAYTMVTELGMDHMSGDARRALIEKATGQLGVGISDLTAIQARVGTSQNRLDKVDEKLTRERDMVEERLADLEGVDPAEAKIKFDTISTQVEMSYSLTTRLLRLSILNYA